MNDRLKAILGPIASFWNGMTNGRRILFVLTTIGVLVGVLTVSSIVSQERYVTLFGDLSPEDAQSITAKLKELKVPHKIENHGSVVMVPDGRVDEIRLELAGSNLPRGGGSIGNEIFDKSSLGATEFQQRIQKQRALEGELQRTIGSVASIAGSRVHLVMPERSVFATSRQVASASVVLKLRAGRALSKGEVASIVHLVSSAVPGLSPDQVSVIGTDGQMLHRPKSEGGGAESQDEKEQELAVKLSEKARQQLERVVGVGHADIRVSVELESVASEVTEKHYAKDKFVLRSEQATKEKTMSGTQNEGVGVPGAADDSAGGETSQQGSNKESTTRNFEIDEVVTRRLLPAGRVKRISLAVLVDAVRGPNNAVTPREKGQLESLGALAKTAVGFDQTRGDGFQIESATFVEDKTEAEMHAAELASQKPKWYYPVLGGSAAIAALVAIMMIRGTSKRIEKAVIAATKARKSESANLRSTAAAVVAGAYGAPLPEAQVAGQLPPGTAVGPDGRRVRPGDDELRQEMRSEAMNLAAKDPASAAVVLKEWLNAGSANTPAG